MAMSYEEMDDMEGKFIPESCRYLVDSMSAYSRNRFKLQTVSAETASAGRIVVVNLPEQAIVDLQSFRLHMDAKTTQATVGGATVFGKLPNDAAATLIQRVEVNMNGIALNQGHPEWNTVYQMKKLAEGSVGRASTVDRLASGYEINSNQAVDDESLVLQDWTGLIGESSTRFLDLSLFGAAQIRITLAPNSVLVPLESGSTLGADLSSPDGVNAAKQISYSVDNIFFTIDSVSLNPIYSKMLRDRLENDDFLPLNFKECYTFSLDSINTGSSTTRFSVSSESIDNFAATYRDSSYQQVGVKAKSLGASACIGMGAFLSNYLRFRNYDSSVDKAGTFRYNWTLNNVQYPQYAADKMDAICDINYCPDKVGMGADGTLVATKSSFQDGKFILHQKLNHPTRWGVGCRSGADSRGINTMCTLAVQGQDLPVAPLPQGETGVLSAFVVVSTTAQARVAVGKSIAVLF